MNLNAMQKILQDQDKKDLVNQMASLLNGRKISEAMLILEAVKIVIKESAYVDTVFNP